MNTAQAYHDLGAGQTVDLSGAALYELAQLARDDRFSYFGAEPYLDAMECMHTVGEDYGADRGSMVVAYFLSNAATWRGPVARAVKAELKRRLKS